MSRSEISKAINTPSLIREAVQKKRKEKQKQMLEIETRNVTNQANGDTQESSSASPDSSKTTTTTASQEVERIDNTFAVNRNVQANIKDIDKEKEKKQVETDSTVDQINNETTAWINAGGLS